MCGIAGLLSRGGGGTIGQTVIGMTTALAHRGPDAHDVWTDAAAPRS